ncbi:MAG: amidohydrolase [Saprospiraceae bacterium]|nr:amidohydrolase [Saprospiraceae bacterium]
MSLESKLYNLSLEFQEELIEIRRHLHMHPELSFKEYKTAEFIQSILDKWGIKYSKNWATTGIVGDIQSSHPSDRVVALRADMDALLIREDNNLAYCSMNDGIMHACGHDVHMTCLLGAIKLLHETKENWNGSVRFIFQPGEEKLPGGASILLKEKVLADPKVQFIIGQHVQPNMSVGNVGICSGKAMASCDEIYIRVIGKGGHAAMPHLAINPIVVASELILELNELLKNKLTPNIKAILSFGKVNTNGGATNIIPEELLIEGTFRCLDEDFRNSFHNEMQNKATSIALKYGAKIECNIERGYPCLMNNESLSQQFIETLTNFPGINEIEVLEPRMTSEDFSYYSQEIPAIFYRLGTGPSTNVHSSQFVVNEESIAKGAAVMAFLATQLKPIT